MRREDDRVSVSSEIRRLRVTPRHVARTSQRAARRLATAPLRAPHAGPSRAPSQSGRSVNCERGPALFSGALARRLSQGGSGRLANLPAETSGSPWTVRQASAVRRAGSVRRFGGARPLRLPGDVGDILRIARKIKACGSEMRGVHPVDLLGSTCRKRRRPANSVSRIVCRSE